MSGRVCFVRFVNFAKCQKVPALTVRIRNVTQRQTRRIKLVIPMCPRCCCLRQHGYKDPILESEIDKGDGIDGRYHLGRKRHVLSFEFIIKFDLLCCQSNMTAAWIPIVCRNM